MYDVLVIGGGVVGCSILRELSHTNAKCILIERDEDVSTGCSRANSGIVHAGYDAESGTLKAKFNVEGSKMYFDLCKELNVPCQQIGSLVLAGADGLDGIKELYNRGVANGVDRLEILTRQQIIEREPNVADYVEYALYAGTAGVVSPYELTVALAEQAVINGAEVKLNSKVLSVNKIANGFEVICVNATYQSKVVINAAGFGGANINETLGEKVVDYVFKRGDYYILDSVERRNFNHVCFPLPTKEGKGILVSPTADGNIIVGPTSERVTNADDKAVELTSLDSIKAQVNKMMKNVRFNKAIRVFAGVRAASGDDFIICNGAKYNDFINVLGICSPGLTASPAIAKYVVDTLIKNTSLKLLKKANYIVKKADPITRVLSKKEWADLIKLDSSYARMVCRCEKITEGEIFAALRSPVPPTTLDALKRRVRTGMGRCQGGFCSPRIMDILAKQYGIKLEEVTKCGKGSEVVIGDIKEVPHA